MPNVLRLTVHEFIDLTRWRWVLTNAVGASLANHQVQLNERDWQYEAATDLPRYLFWATSPDEEHAAADEARIVGDVGDWLGTEVFGDAIMAALVQRRPATVQVILPPGAEDLGFLPLELASRNGTSLARYGVTLVIQTAADDPGAAGAGEAASRDVNRDQLRVLGLFSLPEGESPLNLRRERHELVRLVHGIAANGKAAEVRVLQYGVTRDRLRDVLEEAAGWDIVHVSGHGAPGELLLETADGRPDPITAAELADLLDTAREHVRLVTLAACWSASRTAAAQRRLLALPVPDDQPRNPGQNRHTERVFAVSPAPAPPSALATELTSRLGCAVLAMRYPVDDDFVIALTGKFYDLLAAKGQPVPRAVALTLKHLTDRSPSSPACTREFPALSLAAPALFGARAASLTLAAPERTGYASYSTDNLKMAGFDPQPERFVGRTAVMAQASEALAPGSRIPGLILHGMPGGGKTACALELAYTHEHAFDRLIWFKAPDEGMSITGALTDFALTLERYLPGFQMAHVLVDERQLADFLPLLTEHLERSRILLVLDNAESLLTETGQWRDQRWAKVFAALTGHTDLGRVILTTRRVPAAVTGASTSVPSQGNNPPGSPPHRLRVLPVDALSADEALLLALELPNLRQLIYDDLPGLAPEAARALAVGVLTTAQGHPKLLELADGQAAHPDRLTTLLEAGDQAWRDHEGLPEGFFTTTEPTADPSDYLHVIAAWTKAVSDTLSPGARGLFWFLCCLEESDRQRHVLNGNWADIWQRLHRDREPPEPDQALAALASPGLIALREETAHKDESYALHPGVAAAGRDHAGPDFQDATDTETAAYWDALYGYASGKNDDGTVHTAMLVRAGLASVPYLIRQEQWTRAAVLLHDAFVRSPSRANAAAVLPAIERIARREPRHTIALANVLRVVDPAASEKWLRIALADAAARNDHQTASHAATTLVTLCRDSGRLTEALALAEQKAEHTRQAGYGPWPQLGDEVQRLQVLSLMGQASLVLDEVQRLREHMATLRAAAGPSETVDPWHVREALLDTGRHAARALGRWQEALDLNAAVAASERDRSAPAADTARTRFYDYAPLLRLGHTDAALHLLQDCRQVFQDTHDIEMLGKTLSALADTEHKRGHGDSAISLERDALRYKYLAVDVLGIAVSHHNLGNYLAQHARQPVPALASHLTAALIRTLANTDGAGRSLNAATTDLREFGDATEPPTDVTDLCRKLGDMPGTDLAALIARLEPDSETVERTLRDLVAQAQELARQPEEEA